MTLPSPLAILDFFVPKDGSSRRIASGLRFGPHPRHRLDLYAPRAVGPAAPPADGTGYKRQHAARPLPVLLFVYGGGWDSGRRQEYSFAGRAFAALGFLTAIADYRVWPEVQFPAFVEDAAHAANWLVANAASHGGDAARFVLAGHSAGAYNAVTLALDPARFGAPGLAGRLTAAVGLAGPYDFYPFDVKQSIRAFGGLPEPDRTQPVNLVTAAAPPMFLGHGDRDATVGRHNAVNLAQKLREAGVRVVERHYPHLDHAAPVLNLMRPFRRQSTLHADIAGFLGTVV